MTEGHQRVASGSPYESAYADAVGRAHGAVFADIRPASTMVVVAGLLDPRWKVEIEAEATAE